MNADDVHKVILYINYPQDTTTFEIDFEILSTSSYVKKLKHDANCLVISPKQISEVNFTQYLPLAIQNSN